MKKALKVFGYWFLVLGITGCVVRTYPVTKERVDQDLTAGNRGYLTREIPATQETKERKSTRDLRAVEIELYSPLKFEKTPKTKPLTKPAVEKTEDRDLRGNRGFVTESYTPSVLEPKPANIEKYTVQKGDTLQKISQKFYGTANKWTKIYKANKATLKAPDKIYPGQVIDIPVEPLKETRENLK